MSPTTTTTTTTPSTADADADLADAPTDAPLSAATPTAPDEVTDPVASEGPAPAATGNGARSSATSDPAPAAGDPSPSAPTEPVEAATAGPVGDAATALEADAPAEAPEPGDATTPGHQHTASTRAATDAPTTGTNTPAEAPEPGDATTPGHQHTASTRAATDAPTTGTNTPAEAPEPGDATTPSQQHTASTRPATDAAESSAHAPAEAAVPGEPTAPGPDRRQAAGAVDREAPADPAAAPGVRLEEELGRQLGLVEAALVSAVVEGDAGLAEAFDQALTRDRWRLRARLVLLGAAAVGAGPPPPSVFAGAAAVELLHLAHVHHDRGAALVGDHLLARAAQLGMAADAETGEAVARGAVDHVRGQLLDLRDRYDTGRTLGAYTEAAHARTATLTATATAVGARLAGGTEPQVVALRTYGEALGLALQLADDLHELVADTAIDGQPTGEHLRTGVYTLPTLVAIHEAGELLAVLGRPLDRPALAHATQVVRRSGGIGVALTRIHAHVTEATAALAALDPGPVTGGLTELVHAIGQRAWSSVEAQPLVDLPR
jgi:geranylgeranyl pyrophosphate synthase